MEPFSVAAAAITLCPLFFQTARQLRSAAKSIMYARSELEDLTDEMNMFSVLYDQFIQVTEERMKKKDKNKNKKNKKTHAESARKRLISWAESAQYDFEKLSQRVDALSRDPVHKHSVTETVFAHCKWCFNKNHLKYLRNTLIVARQSMLGFTNMCNIEILDELLAHLRSGTTSDQRAEIEKEHGMAFWQCIERLEAKIEQLREQTAFTNEVAQEAKEKISSKQSRSQSEDYSTHTEKLLSFSKTVDRHIERTLQPNNRSSQKSSQSSSSSRNTKRPRRKEDQHYVYIEQHQPTVNQAHEDPHPYTEPDLASPNTARLRDEAKRTGINAEIQKDQEQSTRINPDPIPPLSVPKRSNDTHHSKSRTDANNAPAEPPEVAPVNRSESAHSEDASNDEEGSESEIASDQATLNVNGKWQPTGPFQGTEPRQLRERRRRDSQFRDRE